MSETIESLRRDHANIMKLLALLDRELARFADGEAGDFHTLELMAEYFLDFPEQVHHPKEDLIYARLKRRDPKGARAVGDLLAEHADIGESARAFAEAVDNVVNEQEVSRDAFIRVARGFLDAQRHHLRAEDRTFLPAAVAALRAEDWAEIDARLPGHENPLVGAGAAARFDFLRHAILEFEII